MEIHQTKSDLFKAWMLKMSRREAAILASKLVGVLVSEPNNPDIALFVVNKDGKTYIEAEGQLEEGRLDQPSNEVYQTSTEKE